MTVEQELLAKLNEIFPDACLSDDKTLNQGPRDCETYNLFRETAGARPLCIVKPSGNYTEQLQKLTALARAYKKKIIVLGGGSGVCGAFKVRGGEIAVDMAHLNKIVLIKKPTTECEGMVLAEAGVLGDKLDGFLKQKGFTHGHYPASLAVSTVGGWISTKSNGHLSLYFGNIENLVVAVEGISGKGEIVRLEGNGLKKVFRMEGATMIVTRIWLKIFGVPARNGFLSFQFDHIGDTVCFLKKMPGLRERLKQLGVRLYTVRAYDFIDYRFASKPHKGSSHKSRCLKALSYAAEKRLCQAGQTVSKIAGMLERIYWSPWTVIIYMSSDSAEALSRAADIIQDDAQAHNGTNLDPVIAHNWHTNRFKLSYDKVVERFKAGITVDTFECTTAWEKVIKAYEVVRAAIFKYGLASAHLGIDGDMPYLYFIFGIAGNNRQKYHATKQDILAACVENGIATTHHHGIGDENGGKAGPAKTLVPYAYGTDWYSNTAVPAKREMDPNNIFSDHLFNRLN